MDSLLHNVFTDLDLPLFLLAYAAFGLAGLIAGAFWVWLSDETRDDDLPELHHHSPDPYEIAYLTGGIQRVARLAVYELTERHVIEFAPAFGRFTIFSPCRKQLRRTAQVETSALTPVQRVVWNWLSEPRLASDLVKLESGLAEALRPLCDSYTTALSSKRFLETSGHRSARILVAWTMCVCLLATGLYKWVADELNGKEESVCLILTIGTGLLGTRIVCRRVRLSDLGQRYLEHLQGSATAAVRRRTLPEPNRVEDHSDHISRSDGCERRLRMALFGTVESHSTDDRSNSDDICQPHTVP